MPTRATRQTFRGTFASLALGVLAALPLAVFSWRFMVDDALISARYAAHLWAGHGYRFNVHGPISDGVTPLGWAYLLAPLSGGDPWTAYRAAKWIGVVAWLGGAAYLGRAIAGLGGRPARWAALLLILASIPLGAWSVAGMETGLCLGVAAIAVSARALRQERVALASIGAVAALRPECIPFAMALALGPVRDRDGAEETAPPRRWRALAFAVGPALVVATTRWLVFGRPAPLSLYAKPSDLRHGLIYAAATALLTGAVAIVAWRGLPRWVRGLQLAIVVHWLALIVAGGDWMPLSRLAVVALPAVVLVTAAIGARPAPSRTMRVGEGLRLTLALAGLLYTLITVGPRAAAVEPKRRAVIAQLRPYLQDAEGIATLDVGWVGAATSAPIVDLAGVTDVAVAVLPGGHTTKPVPPALLDRRGVDTLVLLLHGDEPLAEPWTRSHFTRWVELHVADMAAMAERYEPVAIQPGSASIRRAAPRPRWYLSRDPAPRLVESCRDLQKASPDSSATSRSSHVGPRRTAGRRRPPSSVATTWVREPTPERSSARSHDRRSAWLCSRKRRTTAGITPSASKRSPQLAEQVPWRQDLWLRLGLAALRTDAAIAADALERGRRGP